MTRVAHRAIAALLACLPGACAVGPDFHRPTAPADAGYGAASPPAATATAGVAGGGAQHFDPATDIPADWWTLYQSPKLNRLVDDALKANPNVTAAEAALRQSHELYLAQWSGLFPNVQGSFSAQRAKNPAGTLASPTVAPSPIYNLYTPQLTLSYAPDLFGANRRALEAAQAGVDYSRYELQATYVTLSATVVVTAVQEASLRGQIAATERLLAIEHELTQTLRGQRAIGSASELDLLAQQSAEAQTAQTLPPLAKQLGQTRDALTALLGRLPAGEPAETFELADLTLPDELPVSVPSQLVAQRPDVRAAEANLHIASAQAGIAIANMLPQFSIDASLGSAALTMGGLFKPYSGFWTLGATLSQTLFDAGALLHRHRAADAALDQAGAQYRAAVILACQNVADALRALRADADALKASAEAATAAERTLDLTRRQHALGTVPLVSVLNAEQSYQSSMLALVQAQANRYSDTAGLYQALGGGWWHRPGESL